MADHPRAMGAELRSAIEEEADLLERFGMTTLAAKMRACTTIEEATELHQDIEALSRFAAIARRSS